VEHVGLDSGHSILLNTLINLYLRPSSGGSISLELFVFRLLSGASKGGKNVDARLEVVNSTQISC
jgi:hypothetical protein